VNDVLSLSREAITIIILPLNTRYVVTHYCILY